MDLTPYVSNLRQELAVAADAGGDDARALAERLTAPLESAARLVLLDAVGGGGRDHARPRAGLGRPPPPRARAQLRGDAAARRAAVRRARPARGGRHAAGHGGGRGGGGGADQLPAPRTPQGPDRGGRRPGRALGQRLARPRGIGRAGARRPRPPPRPSPVMGRPALHRLGALAMRPGPTSRHRHPPAMDARVTPSRGESTMPTFDTPGPISAVLDLVVGDARITASDRDDTVVEIRPSDPSHEQDVRAAEQTRVEYSAGRLVVRAPRQ